MVTNIKLYFAIGDNINAKNLYYHCKKLGKKYPFARAMFKGLLPDHKLTIIANGAGTKFGMFSVEKSPGHVVPGIVFEVIDDADLSLFSTEFEKIEVVNYKDGKKYEVYINKREDANTIDWKRLKKARLPKHRKKVLRSAIKWRNLDKFEACWESAVCNFMYPNLVKNIFVEDGWVSELRDTDVEINQYNSNLGDFYLDILDGEDTMTKISGVLIYSNSLKIISQIKSLDSILATRTLVEMFDSRSGEGFLSWKY